MTRREDEYRELKQLGPSERRAWLEVRAPADRRGHWWLAMIEHAEFDASPARGLPPDQRVSNLMFAVDLIELAQEDGMPPYYAASRLALLAAGVIRSGQELADVPPAVAPNNLARRILGTFRLSQQEALAVAERLRSTNDIDAPADVESDSLRDINWLLPDLKMLAPHMTDNALAREVAEWLDISSDIS